MKYVNHPIWLHGRLIPTFVLAGFLATGCAGDSGVINESTPTPTATATATATATPTVKNLAYHARVTGSSEYVKTSGSYVLRNYEDFMIKDGWTGQALRSWASDPNNLSGGGLSGRLRLEFPSPIILDSIELFDNESTAYDLTGGFITFQNSGSSQAIPTVDFTALPEDGKTALILNTVKNYEITSLTIHTTHYQDDAAPLAPRTGLSEVEVNGYFKVQAVPMANFAPFARPSAASVTVRQFPNGVGFNGLEDFGNFGVFNMIDEDVASASCTALTGTNRSFESQGSGASLRYKMEFPYPIKVSQLVLYDLHDPAAPYGSGANLAIAHVNKFNLTFSDGTVMNDITFPANSYCTVVDLSSAPKTITSFEFQATAATASNLAPPNHQRTGVAEVRVIAERP